MTAILAIDTATGPCSASVWKDGRIAAYIGNMEPAAPSAALVPMVERAMKEASLAYQDLSAVACTVGPGSFTGIRVGLAAARGIALAAKIPGLGFTTLEVLAFAAASEKPLLAALNAGKGEYYYQGFRGEPLFEPRVGALEEALAALPGAPLCGNAPGAGEPHFPRADALAELAATRGVQALKLSPFYIRPPDAKPMAK